MNYDNSKRHISMYVYIYFLSQIMSFLSKTLCMYLGLFFANISRHVAYTMPFSADTAVASLRSSDVFLHRKSTKKCFLFLGNISSGQLGEHGLRFLIKRRYNTV